MILSSELDNRTIKMVKALYLRAFPRSERKPFGLILRNRRSDILAIAENDEFLGFFIVIRGKNAHLLDYFAIDERHRGNGIGTTALKLLSDRYEGKRMVVEIEDPDVIAENAEERLKRKAFYQRNGFEVSNDKVNLFGVQMLLLSLNGGISFDEYKSVFVGAYGALLGKGLRRI